MLAKAIFTAMSPNPFPEIDEVYLKYGVLTVVKNHIAVFCVMTMCCRPYQGLEGSTFFHLQIRISRSYR
jgi:hypothetical protein